MLTAGIFHYDYPLLDRLRAVLASYRGHFRWADSRWLQRSLQERYPFLQEYFSFDEEGRPHPRFVFRRDLRTLQGQRRYFSGLFPDSTVVLQVGCRYEGAGGIKMGKFHMRRHVRTELEAGRPVVFVNETSRYLSRIRERLPAVKVVKAQ